MTRRLQEDWTGFSFMALGISFIPLTWLAHPLKHRLKEGRGRCMVPLIVP